MSDIATFFSVQSFSLFWLFQHRTGRRPQVKPLNVKRVTELISRIAMMLRKQSKAKSVRQVSNISSMRIPVADTAVVNAHMCDFK